MIIIFIYGKDGEEIVKPCLQIFARCLENIERKVDEIALSKQTVTRRIEELSNDVSEQLKDLWSYFLFFSFGWIYICDVA